MSKPIFQKFVLIIKEASLLLRMVQMVPRVVSSGCYLGISLRYSNSGFNRRVVDIVSGELPTAAAADP